MSFRYRFMKWQVGQPVECDRPEQVVTGCVIEKNEMGSITIVCPEIGIVVCGQQDDLAAQGWRASHPKPYVLESEVAPKQNDKSSLAVDSRQCNH